MSRSNPNTDSKNPSSRWFEWKGGDGKLQWFDKEKKENVVVKLPFTFLLLDQLSTVTGYNKKKGGIHANEIRDSRQDTLVVKFFSGATIAEGLWMQIKDRVTAEKGGFAASCYIAYKDGDELKIGNIRVSGCALGPWFDFVKDHRNDLNTKAVTITAGKEDTSGNVDFTPPVFGIKDTTKETDLAAVELDRQLQTFLSGYLKRTKIDATNQTAEHRAEEENQERDEEVPPPRGRGKKHDPDDEAQDNIPF